MGSEENVVKKELLAHLLSRGHTVWRANSGAFKGKYRMSGKKVPDIIGYSKTGLFIGIEAKCKGNKPTSEQLCFIFNLNRAGGIGLTAYSVEDIIGDGRL